MRFSKEKSTFFRVSKNRIHFVVCDKILHVSGAHSNTVCDIAARFDIAADAFKIRIAYRRTGKRAFVGRSAESRFSVIIDINITHTLYTPDEIDIFSIHDYVL